MHGDSKVMVSQVVRQEKVRLSQCQWNESNCPPGSEGARIVKESR